jgi:hypothetical protein
MGKCLRPLGQIETMMALSHEIAHGTAQGVLALELKGRLEIDALREAIRALHAKYAALRCIIQVGSDGQYSFEESASLEAIEIGYANTLQGDGRDAVAVELGRVLDASRALWGVSLWSVSDASRHLLILRTHHAIFDGDSLHALVEELLGWCHHFLHGRAGDGGPMVAGSVPLALPIDGYLQPAAPPKPSPSEAAAVLMPHAVFAPLGSRHTRYLRTGLGASDTLELKQRCRAGGLEPHAVLSALLVRVAHEVGFCVGPVDFKTAVSLRACVPQEAVSVMSPACYVAVAGTRLEAGTASLSELAAHYQRALFGAVMRQASRLGPMSVETVRAHLVSAVEATQFNGFGITNLGVLALRQVWPEFEVTDYLPLTRRVAGHHAFALHVLEFRQELSLIFVYTEPLMDRSVLGRIADVFVNRLLGYAHGIDPRPTVA